MKKKFLFSLALGLAILALLAAYSMWATHRYSVDAWRVETGYTGPVCLHPDGHSCANGVPYSRVSVNAGEDYGLWVDCNEFHAPYACEELDD